MQPPTNKLIWEGALFSLYKGVKNHMGLQRKANKPDCGAQPVEQLIFPMWQISTLVPEAFIYSLQRNFATQTAFIIFVIGMKR